ncbi:P-loop NTPase fold protein [Aeromonas enteropelogenes]|uniref:P-loop NTPase fold protein n=1 Tax=Aeromonas enteropelogenes TaxID=29489 RepID=UPI003B9DF4BF
MECFGNLGGAGAIAGSEEHLSADRLERAQYAHFLTNYLATEGKQRNYVLNLNAEWGAGKTWFIKRWYMELKGHYPTVYIDAWQQDFSDDPLLTVISSIIDQLKEVAGKDNKIPEGMRQRLLGLFKVGSKLALKAAIKKAGLEEDDFLWKGRMPISWLMPFAAIRKSVMNLSSISKKKYDNGLRGLLV